MFPKRTDSKRKLFGVALLLAAVFFTFGHTLLSPSVAFANDKAHQDKVPHASDSENHSPCLTELHQIISNRTVSDDDQHSTGGLGYCISVVINSSFVHFDDYLISTHLALEKLPPRLPLQQKTQLLF